MIVLGFILLLWTLCIFILISSQAPFLQLLLAGTISFVLANTLLSLLFLICFFAHIPFVFSTAIFIAIPMGYLLLNRKQFLQHFKIPANNHFSSAFLILLLLILHRFSSDFLAQSNIWGNWDAWAIWSLHAKFLLQEAQFSSMFSESIAWTHPDYPLMLPGLIALYWKLLGSTSPMVPLLIAFGTSLSVLLICFSSLQQYKWPILSIFVLYILIKETVLLPFGSFQYADTLLALFILLSFVCYQFSKEFESKLLPILTGFFAASCGWIKNEGLLFFLIFVLLYVVINLNKKRNLLLFLSGAILPLVLIFYFKLHFDVSSDLFSKEKNVITVKLRDPKRYQEIWDFMYMYVSTKAQIIFYALLCALFLRPKYFLSFSFFVLFTVFAGYFFIYVITPNDLNWHLSTSFDRLLHQISPAIIYTIALSISKENKKLLLAEH